MTVELKIENDAELRAYVKDLIRGQFDAEARQEIREAVAVLFEAKIKNITESYWTQLLKEAAAIVINKELNGMWSTSYKQKAIREALIAHIDAIFHGESREKFIVECAKQLTKSE